MKFAEMNVGPAVPSLTTEVLNKLLIAIPSAKILKRFDEIVTPMFQQIEQNIEEIKILSSLRDLLLPKLMKKEIEIKGSVLNPSNSMGLKVKDSRPLKKKLGYTVFTLLPENGLMPPTQLVLFLKLADMAGELLLIGILPLNLVVG